MSSTRANKPDPANPAMTSPSLSPPHSGDRPAAPQKPRSISSPFLFPKEHLRRFDSRPVRRGGPGHQNASEVPESTKSGPSDSSSGPTGLVFQILLITLLHQRQFFPPPPWLAIITIAGVEEGFVRMSCFHGMLLALASALAASGRSDARVGQDEGFRGVRSQAGQDDRVSDGAHLRFFRSADILVQCH
jgi:hypothetical protein